MISALTQSGASRFLDDACYWKRHNSKNGLINSVLYFMSRFD